MRRLSALREGGDQALEQLLENMENELSDATKEENAAQAEFEAESEG